MSDIAIVIAKQQGGLAAVLNGSGYNIVAGTEREFTPLTTYSDVSLTAFGHIDIGESGWIAIARIHR